MIGPVVVQLLGFPGVGKYTIACEVRNAISARGDTVRLLDNHATANLILELVPPPPPSGIPAEVMARVNEIRRTVYDAIDELSPPDWSFIFTNFLPPGASPAALDRHRRLAYSRGANFVPVVLRCGIDETVRRGTTPWRQERHKLVDPDTLRAVHGRGMTIPDWPELVEFDITDLDAAAAAAEVLRLAGGTHSLPLPSPSPGDAGR